MKCHQDLRLNLWYDFKMLLWQDELNPRVRCAFGNVYFLHPFILPYFPFPETPPPPKWPSSHDYPAEYSHYEHRVWIWPLCMNMTKGLWGPNGSVLGYHIRPNVEMSDFGVLPPVVITITITRLDSIIWTKLQQVCSKYSALKSIDRSKWKGSKCSQMVWPGSHPLGPPNPPQPRLSPPP